MRIRFHADGDYRSEGGRWQENMKVLLGHLNKVVGQSFGVRFEAAEFRRWDRTGPNGALVPMLEQLEKLDPGPDVDWVVGLVSSLPLVSMSFHDLGKARVLGRHFVLRGMNSVAEMQDFERMFKAMEQSERDQLYGIRKAHKETSVFLHEWAHTLGAPHVEDPTRIMNRRLLPAHQPVLERGRRADRPPRSTAGCARAGARPRPSTGHRCTST